VTDPTLHDVGEFAVVSRIQQRLGDVGAIVGPGDDAAVVSAADARVVVTTDMLVEGRHFRLDWSTPYDVGRKAAAQNLADIAAMGARSTALVVALGAPRDWPVSAVEALTDGLRDEAEVAGAVVVGGDLSGADAVVVAVTALGELDGRAPVLRSGARAGEIVVLAGVLGRAAAGLALLEADERTGPLVTALVDAHRRPHPPYAMGPALALAGATAMIDVSDGLLADLSHIAVASGVAIELDEDWPSEGDLGATRGAAQLLGVAALEWMATGGDDHALVATLPPGTPIPPGARRIGVVTRAPRGGVTAPGTAMSVAAGTGWEHFA
jgi:thiamine-monophosphate kinase